MKRWAVVLALGVVVAFAGLFFTRERDLSKHGSEEDASRVSAIDKHAAPTLKVAASVPSQPSNVSAPNVSPLDATQAQILREILASKNDNDPRLDTELRVLGPGAKALFQAQYSKYSPEKRNERGTIVFLVGRNLTSENDFDFLKSVLGEPPCLSLADCSKELPGSTSSENLHHEAGTGVTLAYPQLVALKSLERFLSGPGADPRLTAAAMRDLEAARRSPVARVASMAEEILSRYHARH